MQKKNRFQTGTASKNISRNEAFDILTRGIPVKTVFKSTESEWKGRMQVLSVRDLHGELCTAVQICDHTDAVPVPAASMFPIRIARLCHQYSTLAELRLVTGQRSSGDRYQFESKTADLESLDLVIEALRVSMQREIPAVVSCVDKKTARLYQRLLGFSVVANSRHNQTGSEVILIMLPLLFEELQIRARRARRLEALLDALA